MSRIFRALAAVALSLALLLSAGCGYRFQGRHNPLRELGVNRIYVEQFRNQSYRPGVEQLFSSAMIREIQKSGSFTLANSRETADAVLRGNVTSVGSDITSVRKIELPGGDRSADLAAEFNANVACDITLIDREGRVLFQQSVSGSKVHPGSTDTGITGETVPLINESEQRLAIQFIASSMMASVYQRLIDTF